MMPQKVPQKRYSLFILAILLLLSGGIAVLVEPHDFAIRCLGLAAIMASVYLGRISHVHDRAAFSVGGGQEADVKATKRPGRLAWAVGVALLLLAGVSYLLMYIDALHGGHEAWPVYVFGGVTVACAIVWGYLAAKIFGGGRGKNSQN
jgi:hypothetical protein